MNNQNKSTQTILTRLGDVKIGGMFTYAKDETSTPRMKTSLTLPGENFEVFAHVEDTLIGAKEQQVSTYFCTHCQMETTNVRHIFACPGAIPEVLPLTPEQFNEGIKHNPLKIADEVLPSKIRPNYYCIVIPAMTQMPSIFRAQALRDLKEGETLVECQDVIDALDLNFNLGNTLKCLWRAGRKTPDTLEDLKKARQYLDFEIAKKEGAK